MNNIKPTIMSKEECINLLDSFLEEYEQYHFLYKPEIKDNIIKNLQRARKEFDSSCFFVLIVGPLKSGKSSFVNILTRANVSPTDVLECTAIPTIIGKAENSQINNIVSYYIKDNLLENGDESEISKNIFNLLVDVLRGIEPTSVLDELIDRRYDEATKENITEIVMVSDGEIQRKPVLATIDVPGNMETIIDNQIMIIDMPGLDGQKINDKKPLYKSMVERADFIFFVQSTTSAINEATNDFLTWLLQNKLTNVPLRLIHNYHDSLYFIKDEITQNMVNRQVKAGLKCIKNKFHVERDFEHQVFNFAKIGKNLMGLEDVAAAYVDDVIKDTEQFMRWEQEIIQKLKSERQIIKDRNSITKCKEYLTISKSSLEKIVEDVDHRIEELLTEHSKILGYSDDLRNLDISFENLKKVFEDNIVTFRIEESYANELNKVTDSIYIQSDSIKGKELKNKIDKYAELYSNISFLGENTAMWTFLKTNIQETLTSSFNPLTDAIMASLSERLKSGKIGKIDLSINSKLIPIGLSRFEPDYSDIEEKVMWGEFRSPFDKNYKGGVAKEYIKWYKETCTQVMLKKKITEYSDSVKLSFEKIRIELLNSILEQLNAPIENAKETIEQEIKLLKAQQDTVKDMINKLKS